MLQKSPVFSSFSVDNLQKAEKFYGETLGLTVKEEKGMGLKIKYQDGGSTFIYEKSDHQPATFTILNFVVKDIDETVKKMKAKGIKFEQVDMGGGAKTDEDGIARGKAAGMGPDMAWFKDPAGNWLAIMEE